MFLSLKNKIQKNQKYFAIFLIAALLNLQITPVALAEHSSNHDVENKKRDSKKLSKEEFAKAQALGELRDLVLNFPTADPAANGNKSESAPVDDAQNISFDLKILKAADDNQDPVSEINFASLNQEQASTDPESFSLSESEDDAFNLEITVLNVHSHPVAGEYWDVDFTTKGIADLAITPADQATIDDMQFASLFCGEEDRTAGAQILPGDIIFYPNWSCDNIATVSHFTLATGKHHLIFDFGGETSEAFNASVVWDGGGSNAKWSTAANWAGDIAPSTTDVAVFDGTCSSNCSPTMDVNVNVLGISITSGYSATITQQSRVRVTVGSSGYSQAGGAFVGGDNKFSVNGSFTLSGGTFTPPDASYFITDNTVGIAASSTLSYWNIAGDFTFTGGTINGANKLLSFSGSIGTVFTCSGDFNSTTNISKVLIGKIVASGNLFNLVSGCTLTASMLSGGDIGSVSGSGAWFSTGTVTIAGTFNTASHYASYYNWDSGTGTTTVTGTINFTVQQLSGWKSGPLIISGGGTVNMNGPTDLVDYGTAIEAQIAGIDIVNGTLNATNFSNGQFLVTGSVNLESASSTFNAPPVINMSIATSSFINYGTFNHNNGRVSYSSNARQTTFLGLNTFYDFTYS